MFAGVADSRGIELDFTSDSTSTVSGSRNLLRQLVNNLIDNAIKYTPDGGRVTVSLGRNSNSREVELKVADSGIGIPAEDIPRVFDRFYRAEKSRSRVKDTIGTGLGLSICEAVVDAHRGSITCDSQLNVGTTITVRLPPGETNPAP